MEDLMNNTAATDFMNDNKGEAIIVFLSDGTRVTGNALSVNSKGVNIKVDGKVRSFGLNRISDLWTVADRKAEEGTDALTDVPEDVQAMLHDGMTTAELADLIGTTPKELRVTLRALGMGVGKGRKYSLTPSAYVAVRAAIAAA
jgi:hypothetical protein